MTATSNGMRLICADKVNLYCGSSTYTEPIIEAQEDNVVIDKWTDPHVIMYRKDNDTPFTLEDADEISRLSDLRHTYKSCGDDATMLQMDKRLLDLFERLLPPDHTYPVYIIQYYGHLYKTRGQYFDGEALISRAYEILERHCGRYNDFIWDLIGHSSGYGPDPILPANAPAMSTVHSMSIKYVEGTDRLPTHY